MTTTELIKQNTKKAEFLDMLINDFLHRTGDWPNRLDVLQMAWDTDTDLCITMDDVNKMFE